MADLPALNSFNLPKSSTFAPMIVLMTLFAYFGVLFTMSRLTSRHATNDTFFRAERRSPWRMVAAWRLGSRLRGCMRQRGRSVWPMRRDLSRSLLRSRRSSQLPSS